MTREQAKTMLMTLGIEQPSEDQISDYLNSFQSEINKEKAKTGRVEEELNLLRESAKELEDFKKQNMSDLELAINDRDEARRQVKDLNDKVLRMENKTRFAELGIVGDEAEKLLDSMQMGAFDFALLGQIISNKQLDAVNKKIAELSEKTIQPNSGSIDTDNSNVGSRLVESVANSLKGNNSQSLIDAYK